MTERTFLDGLLDDLCGAYGRFLQTGKADELNAEWQRIIDAVRERLWDMAQAARAYEAEPMDNILDAFMAEENKE